MLVVTAATANISSQVVAHLLAAGERVRVVVRDPDRLAPDVRAAVEVVPGSHREPAVVDAAFAGADAVFWLMPADVHAQSAEAAYVEPSRAAVAAIARHRVSHVVGVSALGRGTPLAGRAGNVTGSLAMDDLFASATHYRALANPSFMDNTLRSLPGILGDGELVSPIAPDRRLPLVATRDIAAAGARLLLDRSWSGFAEVPLLGAEDLSGDEMAAVIADVLGVPVRYRRNDAAALEAAMLGRGASPAMARAMADMATAKDRGLDEGVLRTAQNSTPTTFRTWCAEVLAPAVQCVG